MSYLYSCKISKAHSNEQLVEKERCQGQCDLGLLAWALMGVPSTRVSLQKCMLVGFGFYSGGSSASSSTHGLRECPAFLQ